MKRSAAAVFLGVLATGFLRAEPPANWERRDVRLPPLLWYENDPVAQRRFLMVSLLYWDMTQGRSYQRLFVPFFFRFKDAPSTQTIVPPLYLQRTNAAGSRVTAAWPFLLYDYRNIDRSRIDQAFPVGFRRVRGDSRSGLFLNYGWSVSPDHRTHALIPLFLRHRGSMSDLDLWGLFYRASRKADGALEERRYAGLFPLFGAGGSAPSAAVRTSYLFPLYYYERGPGRWTLLTLPASRGLRGDRRWGHAGLYFYSRGPGRRTDGVFPLWSRSAAEEGRERGLQLLNFIDRRREDRHFQTLFPLYGHWANADGSKTLSWLYCRRRSVRRDAEGQPAGEDVRGWSLLAHWARNAEGDDTRVLLPLYWRYRRPDRWSLDLVFPLFGRYRDKETTITAGVPFLHAKSEDQETWSFLYLYWRDRQRERRRDVLFPLAFYDRGPDHKNFVSPIFWRRRGPLSREGAWPLGYWYRSAEKKRCLVLPVFYHTRTGARRFTCVGPWYSGRNPQGGSAGLFPLWGWDWSEGTRGAYFLPFYAVRRVGENRLDVNYLLLGHVRRTPEEKSHGFFPLYQAVRWKGERSFWAPRIIPLVAWNSTARSKDGWVVPYAWHRSPSYRWGVVLPLWYSFRRYVEGGSSTASSEMLFPLYAAGRDARSRYRVAAPLWWSFDTPRGGAFRLFFPLYWRVTTKGEGERQREVRVVGPWYRVVNKTEAGAERTIGLAPLFSQTRGMAGEGGFDLFGGLFAREVRGHARRFRWFWFFTTPPRVLGSAASKP